MNEEQITSLLIEISNKVSNIDARLQVSVEKYESLDERVRKLENSPKSEYTNLKENLILIFAKIIGMLVLIVASLTGAAPLLKGFIQNG